MGQHHDATVHVQAALFLLKAGHTALAIRETRLALCAANRTNDSGMKAHVMGALSFAHRVNLSDAQGGR